MHDDATTLENSLAVLQVIKHRITIWISNSTPNICAKEIKHCPHTKTCTRIFIAALVIEAKMWKQHKCQPMNKKTNQMWYIHTKKCYWAVKRNEVLIHGTAETKLESIRLSETNQSQKSTHSIILSMWKTGIGKSIEAENRSVVAYS